MYSVKATRNWVQASITAVVRGCLMTGRELRWNLLVPATRWSAQNPLPIAGSAEKPPGSSYRRIELMICGAGQPKIMDVSVLALVQAHWLTLQVQHGRCKKVCFRAAIKALAFPHLCFSQAVNSCPPNHNVPWWTWATKLELSHSASHLHCYWLTLPTTCCQLVFSLLQHLLGGEIQWSEQTGFAMGPPGIQYQPSNFWTSTTNRSFIIFTNFVTDEMYSRVTDRRWCFLCRISRDRFVQWRSTLWLLKKGHVQTEA